MEFIGLKIGQPVLVDTKVCILLGHEKDDKWKVKYKNGSEKEVPQHSIIPIFWSKTPENFPLARVLFQSNAEKAVARISEAQEAIAEKEAEAY